MDFVTAAANLRMHIFSMNMKSRFDVKCKLLSVSHLFSNRQLAPLGTNSHVEFARPLSDKRLQSGVLS